MDKKLLVNWIVGALYGVVLCLCVWMYVDNKLNPTLMEINNAVKQLQMEKQPVNPKTIGYWGELKKPDAQAEKSVAKRIFVTPPPSDDEVTDYVFPSVFTSVAGIPGYGTWMDYVDNYEGGYEIPTPPPGFQPLFSGKTGDKFVAELDFVDAKVSMCLFAVICAG